VGGLLHHLEDYEGDVSDPASMTLLIVGGTSTVAGACFITWFTKKKLDEIIEQEGQNQKASDLGLVVIGGIKGADGQQLAVREVFATSL
tara:strand:- start:140 stop:406 length:267 start_codon:yes stop_codon:yes gene_type:complete